MKRAVSAIAITAITPACTGIGDHEVGDVGDAARHVQADHEQPLRPHFAHRALDVAAHDRAGEHQRRRARQPRHRAHRVGERLFADQRNGVDRDPLAADVVAVGFGDGAERDLADLRAAAHDDDALAVDGAQRGDALEVAHHRQRAQLIEHGGRIVRRLDLEVDTVPALACVDVDGRDVTPVPRDDAGQLMQDAGAEPVCTSTPNFSLMPFSVVDLDVRMVLWAPPNDEFGTARRCRSQSRLPFLSRT